MNQTTPHPTGESRPLYVRAAGKWYSWAGLALTFTGSWLAFTGQIRIGDGGQLRAAPPVPTQSADSWQPVGRDGWSAPLSAIPPAPVPASVRPPAVVPMTAADEDPFLAPSAASTVVPTGLPDAIVLPQGSAKGSQVSQKMRVVLDQYRSQATPAAHTQLEGEKPLTVAAPPVIEPVAPPLTGGPATPMVPTLPVDLDPVAPPATLPRLPVVSQPEPVAPTPVVVPRPAMEMPAIPRGNPAPARNASLPRAQEPIAPKQPNPVAEPPARKLDAGLGADSEEIRTSPTPANQATPKKDAPGPKALTAAEKERAELLLGSARSAVRLRRFDEGIQRFEEYFDLLRDKQDPTLDLTDALYEYAGILVTSNQVRRALPFYIEAVNRVAIKANLRSAAPPTAAEADARSKFLRYAVELGDVYIIAQEYTQAIEVFRQVFDLSRRNPEVAVRLARAYTLVNDMQSANRIYNDFLSGFRPDSPNAPRALGSLLLDLERVTDALPFLLRQREKAAGTPAEQAEVIASIVRAYSRIGERRLAMEAITELAGRETQNVGLRLTLGRILLDQGEFELAGQVYNQVLIVEGSNGLALIGMATVYIELLQPAQARRILDSFIPVASLQRDYLLAYAAYHESVGEYIEARQIYRDMLRRCETDHETRFRLGRLLDYMREWEKAKAEFAKIPPVGKVGRQARIAFANALANQRKFPEAIEVSKLILTEDPTDPNAVASLTRIFSKNGQPDQAAALAQAYLSSNPRSEWMGTVVRLALGRALLDSNRNLQAAREFEIVLARPIGRTPTAYYGLARASERLGNAERSAQLIGCITSATGGDTRNRILLADLFSADFDDTRVVEIITGVLRADPNNLAALIRLVDAQQRIARMTGRPMDCFDTCQNVLTMSPTNVRGHLAMARCFAIAQNYRKATVQYDQLIAIDPDFTIPARERARVLYSDKQYSGSRSQYNQLLTPTPDEQLQTNLTELVTKAPGLLPAPGAYAQNAIPGPAARRDLERIKGSLPDEEARLAVQRLICDYDAKTAEHAAFAGERDAKEIKDLRNYEALTAYDWINRYEPTNTETLFDQGQVHGALKMTRAELALYGQTQVVDPTHRESMVASERASAELSPQLRGGYGYFRQRGRDGLASIDRHRTQLGVVLPYGDENEYIELGYMRLNYKPIDDNSLNGNAPYFRYSAKFLDNRVVAYGQVAVEIYEDRLRTRPTFDVGATYNPESWITTRAGLYLENVVENGETLRQDIFRYGVYLGAEVKPTRTWTAGALYRYGRYSDSNDWNHFEFFSRVNLTLAPKQLTIGARYSFDGYGDQTVFADGRPANAPTFGPRNTRGAIHPYFAPKTFSYGEVRAEFWHWLSRDYFLHSNQCWYSLQYGIGSDDNLETYHNLRGLATYEPTSYLTLAADVGVTRSDVYNSTFVNLMAIFRFR